MSLPKLKHDRNKDNYRDFLKKQIDLSFTQQRQICISEFNTFQVFHLNVCRRKKTTGKNWYSMIRLNLPEQSHCRHVFNRVSGLPRALDCIVSFQLIWEEMKIYHMSRLENEKITHQELKSVYPSKHRRHKKNAHLTPVYL